MAQAELYPVMRQAMRGEPLTQDAPAQTIAEGIAVKHPGVLTTQIVKALVTDILLVGESAMEHALAMILEIEKTVIEGAAAAGFAAVLKNRELFAGKKVGIVMSGGNIDMRMLSNVILCELSREGRISTLDVAIADQPGALSRVAALVGDAGGRSLEILHSRSAERPLRQIGHVGHGDRGARRRTCRRNPRRAGKRRISGPNRAQTRLAGLRR